ncbi:hypothetical protein JRO89_XS04G0215300 [Xanthoceras sorbifolium]|uniref:Caffeoyl-CoA O-methyltransferase n=1 Tax=Xanthoceras sorbifolium TaxID=99658 RepID=A0ABQ8I6U9_9ROSI|nr:hypothetical protein JRO89_XS04G0215300 [Xanthoceras sorbifolium]
MENNTKHAASFSKGLLQSEELYQYVMETSVYPREPEPVKELRGVTAGHPKAVMGTAPDAGQLMAMLLKLVDAKKTIEVGVFTGYSLLLTALTIPEDGKIIAIDMNRESYEIGLPVIKRAGVDHKIDFRVSEALPVLDQLLKDKENEGGFDYAFVDADKVNFWNYHERLMKLLKVGGLVVYDNTLWGGTVAKPEEQALEILKPGRQATLEFNKLLAADPRYVLETSVYPREPDHLKEIRDVTAGHPKIDTSLLVFAKAFEVVYLQGQDGFCTGCSQLIAMILKLLYAKITIEVGVFTGYSLLLTALFSLKQIMAIDLNREPYEIGLPVIKRAGVEHKIDFRESQALPVLDQLLQDKENDGNFEHAYVVADKCSMTTLWRESVAMPEEQAPEDLKLARKPIMEFNKLLTVDDRVQLSNVPLGDGITICRRIY